jgi:hypothetical protein
MTSRIPTPATIDAAPAASRPILEAVKKQLGSAPNLFASLPTAPPRSKGIATWPAHSTKGRYRGRRVSASHWRSLKSMPATTACPRTASSPKAGQSWTIPRSPPTVTADRTIRRPTPR